MQRSGPSYKSPLALRDRHSNKGQQALHTEHPHEITYVPIPGSWRRKEKPNWPDSAFRIPSEVPYGTIYYVTKGRFIGEGSTAHIELLLSGFIVKYPKSNPYCERSEQENRDRMRIEAKAYERVGNSPYIPKLINWNPYSCCLTLEYLKNGSLDLYVRKRNRPEVAIDDRDMGFIPAEVRRRWAIQAATAVAVLHRVDIIHCDITPRNFMLDAHLDLHIADFAGCSISGSDPFIGPGPRY